MVDGFSIESILKGRWGIHTGIETQNPGQVSIGLELEPMFDNDNNKGVYSSGNMQNKVNN